MKAKLHDSFNFLSKITLRRIWNVVRVISSFYYSKITKKVLVKGNPFTISIEPTTACNLACPECPSGQKIFSRPTGKMDPEFFRKTIDAIHKDLIYLIFYFQGEPYLNPKFLEMVSYAAKKKIYTITSTNAHFIDDKTAKATIESGLDRLIISLDGTTQEVYQNYRVNGSMEKVLAGAEHLVKWKKKLKSKTPHLIFQFLVVRPNEHQIEDVKALAKKIGVDEVKFKSAQIYDYKNGSDLIPLNEKYSRYKKSADGTYEIKNELNNYCWKMWHSNVVTWDGKVVPCCFDKDAKYVMGDMTEKPFHEIWESGEYGKFRQNLATHRNQIDICKNCTEGGKVWLLG
jgi:radical SAM protein with 4Fe4S-binding SPASM domain